MRLRTQLFQDCCILDSLAVKMFMLKVSKEYLSDSQTIDEIHTEPVVGRAGLWSQIAKVSKEKAMLEMGYEKRSVVEMRLDQVSFMTGAEIMTFLCDGQGENKSMAISCYNLNVL